MAFSDFFFSDNVPRISATSNVSATLGSPTWLKCKAVYPAILTTPETFWLFNNTRLAKESQHYRLLGENSTTKFLTLQLHISKVSAQDVGWFTCGADFKIDVVTANVFFSLKEDTFVGKIVDKENCSFVQKDSIRSDRYLRRT